jgi:putative ABC transport system ATP-binding protein
MERRVMEATEPTTSVAAQVVGLHKEYGVGGARVAALDGVSLDIRAGEFTAVMGPSGSGKSTLIHCMAALDSPTSGQVVLGGVDISHLGDKELTRLRRDKVGFVFQAYNLVPTLNARENIELPLAIAGRHVDTAWFDVVIGAVGLQDRLKHRPHELSGGQQQRVACARALVSRPEIVFADEPTGNLDSRASHEVLEFLRMSVDRFHQTIVMVTHDPMAAAYTDRVVFLADGKVVDELCDPTAAAVLERMQRASRGSAGRTSGG